MRPRFLVGIVATAATVLTPVALAGTSSALPPPADVAVSDDGPYTRHDGGTDQAIEHCGDPATATAGDSVADDGDVDSNDGGNRRQGNEPSVAIDPTNPDVIVAGWNDYCMTDLAAGWMGLGFSTDGGDTWINSTLPGYPLDDSDEGMESPLKGRTDSGDPLVAFDNDGRLFVGGISFNRAMPQNGSVFVSTYEANPGPAGASGQLPKDYVRTLIIGKAGTPSLAGIFQDKPLMEVDRSTASQYEDNVYFCWTKFQGSGRSKIYFARSTDHGASFERSEIVSDGFVQGCDIAVEHDGDVYVSWRSFPGIARDSDGMKVVRSSDGGATFGKPIQIATFTSYFPNIGGDRDCGDGPFVCAAPSYVFPRIPLEPRLTADQTGTLPGVFATWNAVDPASIVESETAFASAGSGNVGRSLVYVARSSDDGYTWTTGAPVDPSPTDPGHQFFSDIDAYAGTLVAVWQDNRTDESYSVQRPIGNLLDAQDRAVASGTDVVATYAATSTDGATWTPLGMISEETHQPSYEMFGNRDIPFQGDYNWVAIADDNGAAPGGLFAYAAWTDNREVSPGEDPRETEAQDGFVDGFDVLQCRVDLAEVTGAVNLDVPLARADAPYTGDNCGNAGGLDQDIYGTRIALD